ncbi:MAG: hypothetical protein ACREIM_01870 [Nitrospiraceae bacterium]
MGFDLSRLENVQNEPDEELYRWTVNWKPGTEQHIAATVELARRKEESSSHRSWVAIIISALSLIVAVVALMKSW